MISGHYLRSTFLTLSVLLCCALITHSALANNNSPVGKWRSIDDKTGKPKSIILISEENGLFSGKIEELINPSEPNPVCKKCSGDKANQSIQGMVILWDVKAKNDYWSGGKILDPKKGKEYKVKLSLLENGSKLKVRGYIGTPALGRTQIWERVTE